MRLFTARRLWSAAAAVAVLATVAAILHSQGEGASSQNIVDAPPAQPTDQPQPQAEPPHAPSPASPAHAVSATRRAPLRAVRPRGLPASVAVAAQPSGAPAPSDFMGLSFELRSLPLIAAYARAPAGGGGADFIALLRSLGPGVLRFGGISADENVAWSTTARPPWASTTITTTDLTNLAALARASGWHVLLTVNLGHYEPAAAAQEAAVAHAALGAQLLGIEIGNEPDRYVGRHLRAPGWDFAKYRAQALAYRTAIAHAAPGVQIAGPDPSTGTPSLAWLGAAAHALHPGLLTDHYYPLSSCGYRPTIGELLSPSVRRKESAALAGASAIARAAATPLRLDEVNSISCEGFPGTSDTFASALWALDYSARAIYAGASGVNFHDLLAKTDAYSPLFAASPAALSAGQLRAAPEWYALLAAHELSGSEPLPAHVAGATSEDLSASAFRAADGRLRIVLVDYDPPGSQPLAVHLQLARHYRGGRILRLTAPSPAATGGVRLGGRTVEPDGSWHLPAGLPAVYAHAGALSLQLDPSSAAVVTLDPG